MVDTLWERLEAERAFPISAMVCLTERCPLSCGHCYVVKRDTDELSLPELETLFDELASLGTFKLAFTGGDPALRPDLEAIVAAAWARRFVITLKTSGALLGKGHVERLRERGLASLHISLYHPVPEEHDRFVGRPGAWVHAVEALETFRALDGMCIANTVIMGWNAGSMRDLMKLCAERGWSFNADPKILHANDGKDRAAALAPTGSELVTAVRVVSDPLQQPGQREPWHVVCGAGNGPLYLNVDGEVWLCPAMPIPIGNVRERSIARIWEESKLRKRLVAYRWGDSEKCMACGLNRYCTRCPGEAYKEHGDFTRESSVDCRVAAAYAAAWEAEHGAK